MEGYGEAELYAVQQERSHDVISSILVGCVVIIVNIGLFWKCLTKSRMSLYMSGIILDARALHFPN